MIKTTSHSILGSEEKPILIDITFDERQPKAPLIIFIHGFKGFKDWGAHHLTARFFAQNGYRYLKFNLSHSGVPAEKPTDVSDMDAFASNTFSKEMRDIDLVIDYALKNLNAEQVILIGHSRGGGLAILQAAQNPAIMKLITWSAISDFSSLWGKEREDEWTREGRIYVMNARTKEKMPLNITLLDDFKSNGDKLNIVEAAKKINIPWLLLHGDDDVNVPFEIAVQLANINAGSKLIKIKGANHVYGASHPYTHDTLPPLLFQVCEKSLKFLEETKMP